MRKVVREPALEFGLFQREDDPMKAAFLMVLAVVLLSACGGTAPKSGVAQASEPTALDSGQARVVKSQDGSFEGEVIGTPAADSKFAQLRIGMSMSEVQNILDRAPDRSHSYESGKRWIPFYFGNDARRMQALFRGEGCLIFTDGNVWGASGGDLIQIHADTSGACYQP